MGSLLLDKKWRTNVKKSFFSLFRHYTTVIKRAKRKARVKNWQHFATSV